MAKKSGIGIGTVMLGLGLLFVLPREINKPFEGSWDVNGDGVVNAGDIVKLERMIFGYDPIDLRFDFDGVGTLTENDIMLLEQHILGL